MVFASVLLGFRLGRHTLGEQLKPKVFDPGPTDLQDKDPYAEAMEEPEKEKRIQTMKGEVKEGTD